MATGEPQARTITSESAVSESHAAGSVAAEPQETGETVDRAANGTAEVPGAVVMPAGRVSIARVVKPAAPTVPFNTRQLARLDEALTLANRTTGLDFSIYLGDLGQQTRDTAERLHASLGTRAASSAVLIAVSPGQRAIEVITGEEAHRRLSDRACKFAVVAMEASFKEGDFIGGLVNALRILTDQAGPAPRR